VSPYTPWKAQRHRSFIFNLSTRRRWWITYPARLNPGKEPPYPSNRWLSEPQTLSECLPLPDSHPEPSTLQPSHYATCALPAPFACIVYCSNKYVPSKNVSQLTFGVSKSFTACQKLHRCGNTSQALPNLTYPRCEMSTKSEFFLKPSF
jgi:hypothetical protein